MPAQIIDQSFNPWELLQTYQSSKLNAGSYGATACFVGTMRDFNIDEQVTSMTLEHYPAMTQQFLDELCSESIQTYSLQDSLIIHRVGLIKPAEPIVLTAVWSAHRQQAFDACRYLMETLKARAPFWKKEVTDKGERWVHNDLKDREALNKSE